MFFSHSVDKNEKCWGQGAVNAIIMGLFSVNCELS
jgi:hypothetical protein